MKITLIMILLSIVHSLAFAQWDVRQQDIKLKKQDVLERQAWSAPAAAGTTQVLSGNAGGGASGATVTTFVAQPDVARNLVVTPGGTTADVAAGSVVVTGKDILGQTISESFAFVDDQSTAVTGSKAFKSITSIAFPAEASPYGATFSVGYGAKLGLERCMNYADAHIKGLIDGVVATGVTGAASATDVSSNTVIFNAAPNGTRNFVLWYIQNFRCK